MSYVYFAATKKESGVKVRLKIGKSKSPEKRIKQLQTGCAQEIRLIGSIKCKSENHALQIEKAAHKIFAKNHHRGEWFSVTDYVLSQVYEYTTLNKPIG